MTFDSVYEMFNPLTDVRNQHFWDWFSGRTLNTGTDGRWGIGYQDSATGNTWNMADEINGGIKLTTGSAVDNQAIYMSFMDGTSNGTVTTVPIKPFKSGIANMIFTYKINQAQSACGNFGGGFHRDGRGDMAGGNMATLSGSSSSSTFNFRTSNSGGTQGETSSSVSLDTDWHVYKLSANVTADPTGAGTSSKLYIDGVLEASRTSAIGYFSETVAPLFSVQRNSTTSGGASCNVGYCEAWNG